LGVWAINQDGPQDQGQGGQAGDYRLVGGLVIDDIADATTFDPITSSPPWTRRQALDAPPPDIRGISRAFIPYRFQGPWAYYRVGRCPSALTGYPPHLPTTGGQDVLTSA